MTFELDILCVAFLSFLWLTCAFEAFNSLSGGRIRRIESKDPALAEKLEKWMENEDALRAVFKLLLFLMVALLSTFAFAVASRFFEFFKKGIADEWAAILVAFSAIASTFLGEALARVLLHKFDLGILRMTMPLVAALASTIFLPLVALVRTVKRKVEGWDSEGGAGGKTSVEDEILSFVESYGDDRSSSLEEDEKRMIRGIFDLDDMSVREIMTPRVDLLALPSSASVAEAKAMFVSSGHSRIPIYGRSVDEIKGILYAKDFLDEAKVAGRSLDQLAHKPIFIPETKAVGELFNEIKRTRNHFAVIIDEYGGTAGVVTFEDIIEEIVGEIHDEYDSEEDIKSKPQLMPDGSIILEARTLISDVNEILDADIPDNDAADTIGGFVCSELGRIPDSGEEFAIPGKVKVSVLKADKRKIQTLKLTMQDEDE